MVFQRESHTLYDFTQGDYFCRLCLNVWELLKESKINFWRNRLDETSKILNIEKVSLNLLMLTYTYTRLSLFVCLSVCHTHGIGTATYAKAGAGRAVPRAYKVIIFPMSRLQRHVRNGISHISISKWPLFLRPMSALFNSYKKQPSSGSHRLLLLQSYYNFHCMANAV